jgi:putative CocE/NonD family hydrolase
MALLCLVATNFCLGQQLYFRKVNAGDSVAIAAQMPRLATEAMAVYKNNGDQQTYLNNLFRLQILAKKYPEANETITTLRRILKAGNTRYSDLLYVQYELYGKAKMNQSVSSRSFKEEFTGLFQNLFKSLDDKTALYISTAFITRNGVAELHDNFQRSLAGAQKKDSIDINTAIGLCKDYFIWQVYQNTENISRQLLKEDDTHRYIVQDSILIKTRDGASISAIVVRKRGVTVPQPTVLEFTIYTGAVTAITRDAVANGYVGMIAFTRGKRFGSGEIMPYEHDGSDCYDVIDWISKQPWSNGQVGMYGGSYGGFTQWAAAKKLHPALKTIVPSASVAPGLDVPMMNNVFENFVFPWIYYVSNDRFLDAVDYNNTAQWDSLNAKWYASGKPYRVLDSLTGRGTNKIFQSWIAHPAYDEHWQHMIPYKNDFGQINIPVLSTTGYYDGGQVGAMYYLREHLRYNKKADHYLIIGPYSHYGSQGFVSGPDPDPVIAGYRIDPAANIHIHEIIFQWFDYILKGGKKPEILRDRINYEVMGGNEWQHKPSLAKMNNDTLRFYLNDQPLGDHYLLSQKKSTKKRFIAQKEYMADRKTFNTFYHPDTIIYNKLDRSNGLVFVSDPVKSSVDINGCFLGKIRMSINKRDIDYNINLYELMPDGKYFYLSYFMGRASYAADPGKRILLQPGQITSIPFTNTYMTSKKISAGSRIVIVLSINKSRDNQINYGTGKDVSKESIVDAGTPLLVKWYNDSYVDIPVWK